jgi:DHA2 family multidrug resistance protein
VDQRVLLTFGCLVNALSLYMMSNLTLGMDYWTLTFPRVIQGFALGFIFVPLSTLTLATIRKDKLVNATSAYNVLRNLGGSVGIALATTLLAQRSQLHQQSLVSHVTVWDPATQERLARWTSHFLAQGSDAFTAQRQAVAMLYQDAVGQAQVLAYADDFWLLAILFSIVPLFLPLMRRVRAEPPHAEAGDEDGRVAPLPAPVD